MFPPDTFLAALTVVTVVFGYFVKRRFRRLEAMETNLSPSLISAPLYWR